MECIKPEVDQSTVCTEADSQHRFEINSCVVEKEDDKLGSLFGPFSHQMKPDPEYARLVSERSASNQEATTKLINDRHKLIMASAARRKEKEQNIRGFAKSTQSSNNIDSNKAVNSTQFSVTTVDDTEKTTQLLHNLCLTLDSPSKDRSEEICDNQHEMNFYHRGLNKLINLNFDEINSKANISNFDMLKTEADSQHRFEINSCLGEKEEDKLGSLFGPFSHQMDPEYARLVSERSASNQEATTKLINDRYKLIMACAARRKEKEQNIRGFAKSSQSSNNIDSNKAVNSTQFSITTVDDTEKTTKLLHNLCLTLDSPSKDNSEEICNNQHGMIFFHRGLNKFIKLNFDEINSKANISNFDMLKTVNQN